MSVGDQRLTELAHHLLYGKLGHKRFDFEVCSCLIDAINFCGTAGCALGEMPTVWPDVWEINLGWIRRRGSNQRAGYGNSCPDAHSWFEINDAEYEQLFFPVNDWMSQSELAEWKKLPPDQQLVKGCYATATKEEVANAILAFVSLRQQEKA